MSENGSFFVPENIISDESLTKLCDVVENALEGIVLQFRGQFFEEGMEEKLRTEFEIRLTAQLAKQEVDIDRLPLNQKQYINKRIIEALDLFHKEYES